MEEENPPDIFVLAKGNYPSTITNASWGEKIPNIAEFDIVILDLTEMNTDKLNFIKENSYFSRSNIHNLLWGGNQLIILTDGKTYVKKESSSERKVRVKGATGEYIFKFLPIQIPFQKEKGETIRIKNELYEGYFKEHVNQWNFYIKEEGKFDRDLALALFTRKEKIPLDAPICKTSDIIAENGFNRPISFSMKYGISQPNASPKKVFSGPITILQSPEKLETVESAIKSLISNFGIHIKSSPPIWVKEYEVPGEPEIENRIKGLEKKKEKIENKIDSKKNKLNGKIRYKKLLYEKGKGADALQGTVWDTLEEIGFSVNRYDNNKEDGTIKEGENIGVLEIKGSEKSLATEDVRQLDDWIADYTEREGNEPIGILIGNHYRFEKPENRDRAFPSDMKRYVRNRSSKVVMLTTEDLFKIFVDVKSGKANPDKIRKEIIDGDGIYCYKN